MSQRRNASRINTMESHQNDEYLMQCYREGDSAAFSDLYKRYQGRIYAFLRHKGLSLESAEEVFQNIWAKLHRTRFRYEAKFKFSAWIFTIARSAVIDLWRKEKKFAHSKVFEEAKFIPLEEAETKKSFEESQIPWEKISVEDRQSLEWRYLEDSSFEEIAQRLGLSSENVRQRISRALRKLKKILKDEK